MSEYVVGVDEVGRGSLVGSAIICAFRSQNSLFDKLPFSVSDSKKINKKKEKKFMNISDQIKVLNIIIKLFLEKKNLLKGLIFTMYFCRA